MSTRNLGLMRLFDQHIIAESFSAKLLNIVFCYDLINLNTTNKTYAATDLGDHKNRISFQITYTSKQNHRVKIQDSLDTFIKRKMYKEFDRLCFLFLGGKQKTYNVPFVTNDLIDFDPYRDVLNLEDIIRELPNLNDDQLSNLVSLMETEFQPQVVQSKKVITSFLDLAKEIWPLLADNSRAFKSFSPNSSAASAAPVNWDLELWENTKKEIILPNNQQILELIKNYNQFVPNKYIQIFDKMKAHIYAFEKHCENPNFSYNNNQFPKIFSKIIDDTCFQEEAKKDSLEQFESWISLKFEEANLTVIDAYLIGSALRGDFLDADVDVFVLFDNTSISSVKSNIPILEEVKQDFLLEFGIPLHIIAFSSLEKKEFYEFLDNLERKKKFIR